MVATDESRATNYESRVTSHGSQMKTGVAHLPLHGGRAPAWLFQRMVKLAREMTLVLVRDFGPEELLRRLSDPFWFQAFGCVLGFDWHSSGVTTTVCGALKEGLRGLERDTHIFIAGGKGAASRKTPSEIEAHCYILGRSPMELVHASRLAAKVDSAAVQDGYDIYHHCFLFTTSGHWAVVQQGMNEATRYARRYHWLGDNVTSFVNEPHAAVCCDLRGQATLNLVAAESEATRTSSLQIVREHPDKMADELNLGARASRPPSDTDTAGETPALPGFELTQPRRHVIRLADIDPKRLHRILLQTYEARPESYEHLLGLPGVGPQTLRALALISELLYGTKPSWSDPARFSFAHGGKDGHPYPVNREVYDLSVEFLKNTINSARIELSDKRHAFRRLAAFAGRAVRPRAFRFADVSRWCPAFRRF